MKWTKSIRERIADVLEDARRHPEHVFYATTENLKFRKKRMELVVEDEEYKPIKDIKEAMEYLERNKDHIQGDLEAAKGCVLGSIDLNDAIDCIIEKTRMPEIPLGILTTIALPSEWTANPKVKHWTLIEEADF